MRRSAWKSLAWQGIGFLFYLGGMLLFLLVAVNVFLSPPENSIENLSGEHISVMLVSVVLIVFGRLISWKFGGENVGMTDFPGAFGGREREQSQLEAMGYRVPTESSGDSDVAYEDGELYVICGECGTKNEREFSYCSHCSAELPK